jgi:hypothetical protein
MPPTTSETMKAVAEAARPFPRPTAIISLEDLRKLSKLSHIPLAASTKVSKQRSKKALRKRKFYYFPFLPPELRDDIWKLATPTPEVLRISIDGCRYCPGPDDEEVYEDEAEQEDNHDDSDEDGSTIMSTKSTTKPLPFFTYSAGRQFAVTECCKEARHIYYNLLPKSLPSLATQAPEPRIRFDPNITAIHIDNLWELLDTVDCDKDFKGEDWFNKESCVGNGITTLVVHESVFWNQNPTCRYAWANQWRWVGMFKHMLKDVKTVVAWDILNTIWNFEDDWVKWEYGEKDANEAEESEGTEDSGVAEDESAAIQVDGCEGAKITNSAPARRRRDHGQYSFHIDWFEKLLNDHFAYIVEELEQCGYFNPRKAKYRQRPQLKLHESSDINKSLNCFSLPIRPRQKRFLFGEQYNN